MHQKAFRIVIIMNDDDDFFHLGLCIICVVWVGFIYGLMMPLNYMCDDLFQVIIAEDGDGDNNNVDDDYYDNDNQLQDVFSTTPLLCFNHRQYV